MSQSKKWCESALSYKNGLYLMYHVMKGRKDKRKGHGSEVVIDELTHEILSDEASSYECSMCGRYFTLLSSFLLHVYRHSDPCAIQNDIKKEEELTDQEFSYLKGVGEVDEYKKELEIKEEEVKTEENEEVIPPKPPTEVPTALTPDFTCYYCTVSFSDKKYLRKHLKLHLKYFDHQSQKAQLTEMCDICMIETETKEALKEHYFTSHNRSSRICRICKQNFGSNALRKTHEKFFHKALLLDCISCRFGFKSIKDLMKHSLALHNVCNEKCVFCHNSFQNKSNLLKHMTEFHTSEFTKVELDSLEILLKVPEKKSTHQCLYCEKSFSNQKLTRLHETRQHLSSKEDDPGYTCQVCNSSFSKRANGLRHSRLIHGFHVSKHSGIKVVPNETPKGNNISCDECSKTFPNARALILHSKKTHSTQTLIFQCGVCDKKVKSFQTLRDHIEAVHEKRLVFFCDVCGNGHTTKSRLRSHIITNHITARDFTCSICKQTFAQLGQLNVHQKIHSTKKLHTCPVCQKSFAQLSGLHQHSFIHSDIPKYSCQICQLTFKYPSSFYNHRKSHLQTTEYKCSECNRQCPSRFSLYAHRKTHHAAAKFDCSECGKMFKRKDTLKYHILNKHTSHAKYTCEYCDEGFKTKRDRKHHMSYIHMQLL